MSVIFLYTDAAEISDDVRAKMVDAGYLPVRVANMDAVKILPMPLAIKSAEIPMITAAALDTILKSAERQMVDAANFGVNVARNLRKIKGADR